MTGSCAGKVVLVAGGTRGIGRACCLNLARAGATVVVSGRSEKNADEVVQAVSDLGGVASTAIHDISDVDATAAVVDDVHGKYGRIDALVANAGMNPYFIRAEKLTTEEWDDSLAVNLRGLFFAIQAAGKHMLAAGRGSIVTMSSVTAQRGTLRGLPYVAAKGGLDAMTRTLAVEWADRGVRVNGVAPGYIETDLTEGMRQNDSLRDMVLRKVPAARFGTPDEVAALATFLVSDAAAYMSGQVVTVDGGYVVS
ncbi:SDR family NAD(P)-dependent oxidoreductase [Blastococcus tunisiensis]|uniref:SDR family NAD(P)-dependent oxidoreductase n=1 Tax=Blastococcus tunisiensis TaxID=1798228 RepID=UPI001587BDBC|nr:SDR family NAD(P)-dependent oxidoreductase [Blastococcus sp. DSM 46838]